MVYAVEPAVTSARLPRPRPCWCYGYRRAQVRRETLPRVYAPHIAAGAVLLPLHFADACLHKNGK